MGEGGGGLLDVDRILNHGTLLCTGCHCGAWSGERQGVEGTAHHRHVRASSAARCLCPLRLFVASRASTSGDARRLWTADDAQFAKERSDDALEVRSKKHPPFLVYVCLVLTESDAFPSDDGNN